MYSHVHTDCMQYIENFKCLRFETNRFHRLNCILHIWRVDAYFILNTYNVYIFNILVNNKIISYLDF